MRRLTFAPFILALLVLGCIHWCDELRAEDPPAIAWQSDYVAAYQKAEAARRMLVIYFSETAPADESQACVATLFAAAEFRRGFAGMTCLRLPLDAKVADEEGRPIRLIDHFSMTELHKQPGFALIDFREPESKHFARVVSLLPIGGKRRPTIAGVAALADLPAGSLTQRTLIWAVRIHGESPASTSGRFEPILAAAAARATRRKQAMQARASSARSVIFASLAAAISSRIQDEVPRRDGNRCDHSGRHPIDPAEAEGQRIGDHQRREKREPRRFG
mgnify:CR=1 FL=1